jgi:aldose 1-epimerase
MSEQRSPVLLTCGALSVEILPAVGGCLASFRQRRAEGIVDLMRPMSDTKRAQRNAVGASMFPMLPYANRVAGGRFQFQGRSYALASTERGDGDGVHGTAWRSEWDAAAGADHMELTMQSRDLSDPFAYEAVQRFSLEPHALRVELAITNRGRCAMPFGMGLHPWFARAPQTQLRFAAREVWMEDANYLPTERAAIPPEWNFAEGKRLPATWINNCFTGWDGVAEIIDPALDVGLRVRAGERFRYLHVFSDPALDAFCVEPQTHAIGALNRVEDTVDFDGLELLQEGQSMSAAVRFEVFERPGNG